MSTHQPPLFLQVDREKLASQQDRAIQIANKEKQAALFERRRAMAEQHEIDQSSREVWQ